MKASVIILNWNGRHLLGECLDSILQQDFHDFEIIVVDNGSTDQSVEFIQENYKDKVRLITLNENKGFAAGNNVGIADSKGEYILLLNNDTKVDPNWIKELVRVADEDKTIGSCASKIVNYYQPDEFDTLGHLMYMDGLNRGRGKFEKDHNQYNTQEEVFFASGCAALYRKKKCSMKPDCLMKIFLHTAMIQILEYARAWQDGNASMCQLRLFTINHPHQVRRTHHGKFISWSETES